LFLGCHPNSLSNMTVAGSELKLRADRTLQAATVPNIPAHTVRRRSQGREGKVSRQDVNSWKNKAQSPDRDATNAASRRMKQYRTSYCGVIHGCTVNCWIGRLSDRARRSLLLVACWDENLRARKRKIPCTKKQVCLWCAKSVSQTNLVVISGFHRSWRP